MNKISFLDCPDLTEAGFTKEEIQAVYFSHEPLMQSITDAASQMSARNRRLTLAIMKTILVSEERPSMERPSNKLPKPVKIG